MTSTPTVSNVINIDDFRRKNSSTSSALNSWKDLLKEEIEVVVNEWDGELMVNNAAIDSANFFIDNLPCDIRKPSIALENKEAFLFEWSQIENNEISVFSAIVEKDRIIFSTYNFKEIESTKGVFDLSAGSISMISSTIILKHFTNQTNHGYQGSGYFI